MDILRPTFTPILLLDDLVQLYTENQAKLYMTEGDGMGSHRLNEDNYRAWVEHIRGLTNISNEPKDEISTYLAFAQLVHEKTRYVQFPEYMEHIRSISHEVMELIRTHDIVFFVVSGEAEKSNTWVTLLCVGELLKLGVGEFKDKIAVVNDLQFAKYTKFAQANPSKRIVAVHYDDMSYSGTQIDLSTPSKIDREAAPNFSYYIAIPFITTFAKQFLEKKGLLFLTHTETISTIQNLIESYYSGRPDMIANLKLLCTKTQKSNGNRNYRRAVSLKRGHDAFGCYFGGESQSLLYFDHKIADYVSVVSGLFNFGTYPIDASFNQTQAAYNSKKRIGPERSGSLVSSCTDPTHEECFQTFYKRFTYTFLGKEIDREEHIIKEITAIKKASAGGGRRRRHTRAKRRTRAKKNRTRRRE